MSQGPGTLVYVLTYDNIQQTADLLLTTIGKRSYRQYMENRGLVFLPLRFLTLILGRVPKRHLSQVRVLDSVNDTNDTKVIILEDDLQQGFSVKIGETVRIKEIRILHTKEIRILHTVDIGSQPTQMRIKMCRR